MANITIVKLKVRRGSDAQRRTIVLDQGEAGYTIDTKRLFIGDGSTTGGHVIGNKGLGSFTSLESLGDVVGAQVGDIGYANSLLWMISSTPYGWNSGSGYLSGFAHIGTKTEGTGATINFDSDGKIAVKKSSLDVQYFKSTFFGSGILSAADGSAKINLNTVYFELSGDAVSSKISPKQNSITEREIATTALSSGLQGGNNVPVKLYIDTNTFGFEPDGKLILTNTGSKTVQFSSFNPDVIGDGLKLDDSTKKLEALFQKTNNSLSLTDGVLSIAAGVSSGDTEVSQSPELPFLTVSDGIVTGLQSSIYDTVTGIGLSGNDTGSDVPVGTVLPHAKTFPDAPAGYLLCDGKAYDSTLSEYKDLYDVIGTSWNEAYGAAAPASDFFRIPNLTGGNVLMYGANAAAPGSTLYKLSATDSTASHDLEVQGYNFIIRYSKNVGNFDLFNGAPNQVSKGFLGKYDQKTYECLDSTGVHMQLSSAGFMLFALSGDVRKNTSSETFDKFAIPVYNW